MTGRYLKLAEEYRSDLDGYRIGHGAETRLLDLSVDFVCDFVWWYFTREADADERAKFERDLWMPPTKRTAIPKQSPWSAENEMSAFAALRAETGA